MPVPNIHCILESGSIKGNDVFVLSFAQSKDTLIHGTLLVRVNYPIEGQLYFGQVGYTTVGGKHFDVFLAEKNDLINQASIDAFTFLLRAKEPFITGSAIPIPPAGESIYLGVIVHDETTWAWSEIKHLGNNEFIEVRNALTHDGKELRVGNTYGDFNRDGVTNGRDMLFWQRNQSVGPMAEWREWYGKLPALTRITPIRTIETSPIVQIRVGEQALTATAPEAKVTSKSPEIIGGLIGLAIVILVAWWWWR